jgi:hypothetical protein
MRRQRLGASGCLAYAADLKPVELPVMQPTKFELMAAMTASACSNIVLIEHLPLGGEIGTHVSPAASSNL